MLGFIGIFMEILPMLVSTYMGVRTTLAKQKAEDAHNQQMAMIEGLRVRNEALAAAREFNPPGTSKTRKLIAMSLIAGTILFPMLCAMMKIPVYLPRDIIEGGFWFFTDPTKTTIMEPVMGYPLTAMVWLLLEVVIGFYFGASAARR